VFGAFRHRLIRGCAGLLLLAAGAGTGEAAERKVLRVGTSGDYAPFSMSIAPAGAGEDAGAGGIRYAGFDIDVARRFAGDHGYTLELVPFRWPQLSADLLAGRFDVAMSGVTVRADRSVIGAFTVPVVVSHAVALAWKGAGIDDVNDLNRRSRRVAVNAGGYLEGVARRTFLLATIVPMPDNQAVHMALMDRWTDAVVTDSFEERAWTATARDVVRIGPLSQDRKAYLVRADRQDLAAQLDAWLLARERDGTLARMRADKLGPGDHAAAAEPLAALVSAVAERMSLMPLVWAAKREARRPVEDKAQEARVLEASVAAAAEAARARRQEPPDAGDVRRLFKALIEAGKDVQQRLADEDRQRRQARAARESADGTVGGGAPSSAEPLSSRLTGLLAFQTESVPLHDLDTELRPALSRLTSRIATIIAALEKPATVEAVQARLIDALAEHRISAARLETIAEAVANVAASNASRR